MQFNAEIQGYTLPQDNPGGYLNSESGLGWTEKEAWVDGIHYNLTLVPNEIGFDYQGDPELEGE